MSLWWYDCRASGGFNLLRFFFIPPLPLLSPLSSLHPHPSNPRRNPLAPHQYSMPLNCFLTPSSFSLFLFPILPSTILFSNSISKSPLRKTQPADCVSDPPGEDLAFDLARSWGNFLVYAYETRIYIYTRHNILMFKYCWIVRMNYMNCVFLFFFFLVKLIVKDNYEESIPKYWLIGRAKLSSILYT